MIYNWIGYLWKDFNTSNALSHYLFKVVVINYLYLVSCLWALSYDAHMLKWTTNDWLAAVKEEKTQLQWRKKLMNCFRQNVEIEASS